MTLLVTGGAGFIGSHFIDYTLSAHPGDRVICLDKLTYAGSLSNLAGAMASPDFTFVRGDICDRPLVEDIFASERPDTAVNFAAESHVDRAIADPEPFLRTNLLGTGVLLDACRKFGAGRFHQISTDEVYGECLPGQNPPDEDAPLRPGNPYSASKASADLLALACRRTYGLPVSITRSANVYGPRQYPEKLVPAAITAALGGRPVPIYGSGENVRDWLYVGDVCRAVDAAIRLGRDGEIFNVGGGLSGESWIGNLDLVKRIGRALGVPGCPIVFVPDRPGHDRRYAMNCSKAAARLGWRPETGIDEGLRITAEWYRRRPENAGSDAVPAARKNQRNQKGEAK